jgi:hypothetical protein
LHFLHQYSCVFCNFFAIFSRFFYDFFHDLFTIFCTIFLQFFYNLCTIWPQTWQVIIGLFDLTNLT